MIQSMEEELDRKEKNVNAERNFSQTVIALSKIEGSECNALWTCEERVIDKR